MHYCADSRYGPYWSVTRYDDIMTVELDHATYSSQLGGIQVEDQPADMKRGSFIRMDPPRHTAQRKTVAPVAAPNNLASYEATIRQRTRAVLDGLPRNETFDWVDKVSIELTTMMLATLFDFPWEERRKLTYLVGRRHLQRQRARRACSFGGGALRRASAHGRRLQGALARAGEGAAQARPDLDDGAQRGHARHARDGVHRQPGAAHRRRQRHDAQLDVGRSAGAVREPGRARRSCKANPALVPSLVAETIRYQTPVIHMRRTATRDTELAGQRIRQGDKVVMWYVSGNRDESVIENPDAFIVDRAKPRQHLSYGAGIHRCVGDRLADLQLRILWEEILARDLDIEVMGPPRRLYSNFIRGIRELPVRIAA